MLRWIRAVAVTVSALAVLLALAGASYELVQSPDSRTYDREALGCRGGYL
jgi:hypothetical protein